MKRKTIDIGSVRLAFQIALLGAVSEELRAICVKKNENIIYAKFFYDGEIADLNRDLSETAMGEVMAHYNYDEKGRPFEFDYQIIRADYPNKLEMDGDWVYYRYEV